MLNIIKLFFIGMTIIMIPDVDHDPWPHPRTHLIDEIDYFWDGWECRRESSNEARRQGIKRGPNAQPINM